MNETVFSANGRIIEQTTDRGDGTGTRTIFDGAGKVVKVIELKDLPIEPIEGRNRRSIEDRLHKSLKSNKTYLDTPNPTQAQQRVQLEKLTKQTNAIIRQLLGVLDSIDDTEE